VDQLKGVESDKNYIQIQLGDAESRTATLIQENDNLRPSVQSLEDGHKLLLAKCSGSDEHNANMEKEIRGLKDAANASESAFQDLQRLHADTQKTQAAEDASKRADLEARLLVASKVNDNICKVNDNISKVNDWLRDSINHKDSTLKKTMASAKNNQTIYHSAVRASNYTVVNLQFGSQRALDERERLESGRKILQKCLEDTEKQIETERAENMTAREQADGDHDRMHTELDNIHAFLTTADHVDEQLGVARSAALDLSDKLKRARQQTDGTELKLRDELHDTVAQRNEATEMIGILADALEDTDRELQSSRSSRAAIVRLATRYLRLTLTLQAAHTRLEQRMHTMADVVQPYETSIASL
jgi:hypothetical protein